MEKERKYYSTSKLNDEDYIKHLETTLQWCYDELGYKTLQWYELN